MGRALRVIQESATCWPTCNFQSSACEVYRGGILPLAGVWPGKFGRPILLERQWPVPIFQELYSIVLDGGPRAIFKVQPAKCTEAASCPWRGSGQESSVDQSYWSGSGQFPSFKLYSIVLDGGPRAI